ncbi:DUF4397 domain-containing protein [bacterium]|nr:DUF4397 domain-containing protein [bacterium]
MVITFFLSLSGCGGGGGGEGSAVGGDRFGIRVLHAGIEISPVEYQDPEEENIFRRARFLAPSVYRSFPEGPLTLTLSRANSAGSRFVSSITFPVEAESRHTVLLYGDNTEIGPRMVSLLDAPPELAEEESAIRFVNGIDRASSVLVSNEEIPFGRATDYNTVNAGELSFQVLRTADRQLLLAQTIPLEGGRAYSLLLGGEAEVFVGSHLYEDG